VFSGPFVFPSQSLIETDGLIQKHGEVRWSQTSGQQSTRIIPRNTIAERVPDDHGAGHFEWAVIVRQPRGATGIATPSRFHFKQFVRDQLGKKHRRRASPRCMGAVMSEVQTRNRFKNRKQQAVNLAAPGRIQRARNAGPTQIDSQGRNNAEPKKHPPTNGGTRSVGGFE
jgi:hypothetical protein